MRISAILVEMLRRLSFALSSLVFASLFVGPAACTIVIDADGGGGYGGSDDPGPSLGGREEEPSEGTGGDVGAGGAPPEEVSEACSALCDEVGFDGAEETDFGNGLVECACSGSGEGVAQATCNAYCADFDVEEEYAFLSSEDDGDVPNKCVCDGT